MQEAKVDISYSRSRPRQNSIFRITLSDTQDWKLNYGHYEAVHGLMRMVNVIPDKLTTAQEIREDESINPENATIIISSVISILQFYLDGLRIRAEINDLPISEPLSLYYTIKQTQASLKVFTIHLRQKNDELLKSLKKEIQESLYSIKACCCVFIKFVIPLFDFCVDRKGIEGAKQYAVEQLLHRVDRVYMTGDLKTISVRFSLECL